MKCTPDESFIIQKYSFHHFIRLPGVPGERTLRLVGAAGPAALRPPEEDDEVEEHEVRAVLPAPRVRAHLDQLLSKHRASPGNAQNFFQGV